MNYWEKITGSDMTKELKTFDSRVKKLPADYQEAWEKLRTIFGRTQISPGAT